MVDSRHLDERAFTCSYRHPFIGVCHNIFKKIFISEEMKYLILSQPNLNMSVGTTFTFTVNKPLESK